MTNDEKKKSQAINYMKLVKEVYSNLTHHFASFVKEKSKEEFCSFCSEIYDVYNIDKLLNAIATQKQKDLILDHLTELNLISFFRRKAPTWTIEYEKETVIDGISRFPDLTIHLPHPEQTVLMQVKHVRKSKDYEEQHKQYPEDFVQTNDEVQLRASFDKAVSKSPCEEGSVLFVLQEISTNADIDDITVSEALYGNEVWVFPSGKPFRKDDGFYKQPLGKHLSAHIAMRKTDHRMITDYSFVARPNPEFGRDDLLQRLFGDIRILSADDFSSG